MNSFVSFSSFITAFSMRGKLAGIRTYAKLSYYHKHGREPLQSTTLGRWFETKAKHYAEKEVLISKYQNHKLTYQNLSQQVDRFATSLHTIGLKKGDRLGIWAPNISEWVITSLASARLGLILVPINPSYQANELKHCINVVGMKSLISYQDTRYCQFYEILNSIVPELGENNPGKLGSSEVPSLSSVIFISDKTLKGTFNFEELLEGANNIKCVNTFQDGIHTNDPYNIMFTSGTTGKPKAAVISHFQIINNYYRLAKRIGLENKHRVCVQVPFFHAFGLFSIVSAIHFGATLVLPFPTYNSNENLKAIQDEKCNIIYGTPTMYVDLINIQNQKKLDVNLDTAVTGGAVCSPHLFQEMKKVLKIKTLQSIYGMTELTGATFSSLPVTETEDQLLSTVGCLQDYLEAKIIDRDGNMVPFGTPGELCIRGYSVMLGYWNNKEATNETIDKDGWLRTGDQFILEEDGYGRIIGRIKDMIIRGGENISPREIEDLLNAHPDILETHVIGLPHERLGEEVCACVRLKEGAQLGQKDLEEFCKGKIAYYKIPSQLKIIENLPKTLSGKVQKYLLKERFSTKNL